MLPVRISPSILSADYVHVDVMDGHFVPNLTIGPIVIEAVKRATQLPLDVHLMIEDAERWVAAYAKAGADIIGVHVEGSVHLHRTLGQIRELGKKPCVVLNPATPVEAIEYVLGDVAQVLLMSVNPGFGGQQFIGSVLPKIAQVRKRIQACGKDIWLEVDGGIKTDNIAEVARAGADTFVAGSAIFATRDYAATLRAMREALAAA